MTKGSKLGLVLSGGGARGAYHVGALQALSEHVKGTGENLSICVGASVGAINSIILSECLHRGFDSAVDTLRDLWIRRTFANTFAGSLTVSFFRSVKLTVSQYLAPGPSATDFAIFNPAPLRAEVKAILTSERNLQPDGLNNSLTAVGVMTTLEGLSRKPLLILWSKTGELPPETFSGATFEVFYAKRLRNRHAFASAALPWVFPPVELDDLGNNVRLIDGGIADNIPIDPAVRLGATSLIVVDTSGKRWWNDALNRPHHSLDPWELAAKSESHCMMPEQMTYVEPTKPFGPVLREVIGKSVRERIHALGPIWPVFKMLCLKMGEEMAFETLSYGVVHGEYIRELIRRGYDDTQARLKANSQFD